MPDPALPVPRRTMPGGARYDRAFLDPLGRPLTGQVRLTLQEPVDHEGAVFVAVGVTVDLADGLVDVALAPGTYVVLANLRSANGDRAAFSETVTLP